MSDFASHPNASCRASLRPPSRRVASHASAIHNAASRGKTSHRITAAVELSDVQLCPRTKRQTQIIVFGALPQRFIVNRRRERKARPNGASRTEPAERSQPKQSKTKRGQTEPGEAKTKRGQRNAARSIAKACCIINWV